MVPGLDSFQKAFSKFSNQFTIIGGTACDLIMTKENVDFRATKDLDIVLIIEALTTEFVNEFWNYVKEAEYEHRNKSTGTVEFYRFSSPKNSSYPKMIELFSRKPDVINLSQDATLTPLPIDDELSSLSAILLNDCYYKFLLSGRILIDGIPILDTAYLIPFKAKAWLDLSNKKQQGLVVDSKNIRKHKNDIFRLSVLLSEDTKIFVPSEIHNDISNFIQGMKNEDINPKDLGIANLNKEDLLLILERVYFSLSKE